ncbi:hypothetical protein JCM10450v2_001886 [Rhodotorula kratochvilovae]
MAAVLAPPVPPPKDFAGVHGSPTGPELAGLVPFTSTPMDRTESSGSESRSSGGDTVAAGADDDDQDEAGRTEREAALARARQIADSLSRLEGRNGDTAEVARRDFAPPPPDKSDEGSFTTASSGRPSAERSRVTTTRTRLNSASPTPRTRPAGSAASTSSRASVATLDSVLTTGESVYEDAKENPDEDGWEDEVMPSLPLSELTQPPVLLDPISLPDRHDPPTTPKADLPQSPFDYPGFSPRSAFEEQAILLQRRASLQAQAQASRRASARQSFSARATDPQSTLLTIRRYSAAPSSTQVPVATRRTSLAGPAPTSPTRQWHPKPLVLTPSRTVQAPLTSATPTSPSRRRGSASTDGGGFTHSRNSSIVSSGGFGRAISPGGERLTPSPRSPPSAGGARRRSLNYIDASEGLHAHAQARSTQRHSLAGASSRQSGPPASYRRSRTASQDTGSTHFTGESLLSRASGGTHGESPDSSVDGWIDEKDVQAHGGAAKRETRGSPLMSDGEWEREYQRRSGMAGPLEMVEEAEGSDARASEQEEATAPMSPASSSGQQKTPVAGNGPAVSFTAATPSTIHAHGSPSTVSSPKVSSPIALSQKPLPHPQVTRHKAKYDEHWNGETVSDSAAKDSDATSFSRPSHESLTTPLPDSPALDGAAPSSQGDGRSAAGDRPRSLTPMKGKPIVIKSMTARSSAAMARRSQRLSQIDPPVGESSHRLSRAMRRLSAAPAAAPASSPPRQHASPPQELARSPRQEQQRSARRDSQPAPQRRMSSPRAQIPSSQTWSSGLAIWPPPAETKTMTLAPPLNYASDGESAAGLSGRESETDDEGFGSASTRYGSRPSRSSGYARERPAFQPRNPRAAPDDEDYGPESWLEVLLNEEPPPRRSSRSHAADEFDQRWSSYSGSTFDTYKKGSARSYGSTRSAASTLSPGKASSGGGLTKKIFGGLRAKSPDLVAHDRPKKPISIAPQYGKRRESTKPRPIVSGPLELQAASSAMAQQRSQSSTSSIGSLSSQEFGAAHGNGHVHLVRPMVHYPSVAAATAARNVQAFPSDDAAEELASLHFDSMSDLRASLDTVFRPPPKQYALPPGLLAHGVAAPLPPRQHRIHSADSESESPSPAESHSSVLSSAYARSRQGSRDNSASGLAFPSTSHSQKMQRRASQSSNEHAVPMREVLCGQALER